LRREATGGAARPGVLGLPLYCLAWGVVVEGVDRAFGDSFDPLDAATHAAWVLAAILALPLFARARRTWQAQGRADHHQRRR
jgi:hypothetical protein